MEAITLENNLILSRREEGGFYVNLDNAEIVIESLVVEYSYNMTAPFRLVGKGGSSVRLTERQLMKLFSEFLRFNIQEECEFSEENVGFSFKCKVSSNDS